MNPKHTPALRGILALTLLAAWLFTWNLASAQAWPPLDGSVADDTGQLDVAEIKSAAAELERLGVRPLVVFSRRGLGYPDATELAEAAAAQYGFVQANGALDPNLFAVVVILDTRRSAILYGDALAQYLGGGLADDLRVNTLGSKLALGEYTEAFADTFRRAAREIDLQRNPPPTTTPVPSVITNIDTEGLGNSLLLGLGVLVLLGFVAVVGPMIWRTMQRNKAAAARMRALSEQLLQARNVAADMITDLDYPDDPKEQIQYRFLALALENERPKQLAEITTQYEQIHDRLVIALATYHRLNDAAPTTEQEITAAIAEYQQVQSEVRYASGFLVWLAEQGRGVEAQNASAPTEVDAAKKALAAASEELTRLAAAAPDLNMPSAETALAKVSAKLEDTVQALNASPPRSLAAYDASGEARVLLERTIGPWRSIAAVHAELLQQRQRVSAHRANGFKLPEADISLSAAVEQLQKATSALAAEPGAAEDALREASALVKASGETMDRLISLHAANAATLEQLKQAGDETRDFIEQGASAFESVDDYAEDSWHDIRGNGTEAQRAADMAFTLWQEASGLNAVTADSPQDFDAARQMIDKANDALGRARELIDAIVARFENIRESQRVAAEEIAAAQHDLTGGEKFVARHDADISGQPSEMLDEAARLLDAARAEMARTKPNWIEVVALARKANDTADRALADARSEHEAMEARRLKVKTALQQAAASLSRASNFASIHRADISPAVFTTISTAQETFKRGEAAVATAQARGVEDVELGRALDDAAAILASAREAADKAFGQAESQFRTLDALRAQAHDAVIRADSAITSADTLIDANPRVVRREAHDLLEQALSLMPEQVNEHDAQSVSTVVTAAQQAEAYATQAHNMALADIEAHNSAAQAQQMQDVLQTLAVLGTTAALSGGGRRRSRGGWGGGISIGGGGWGRGGSSSGGWGGGGSSSGSWGGGGSSGGGWGGGGSSSGGW